MLDGVALLWLDRPEKLNACTLTDHTELADTLTALDADPEVYVVLISGRGRAFSVGGDLSLIEDVNANPQAHLPELMDGARRIVTQLIEMDKPVVCAVNGVAMGVGAAVALLSDYVVMDESARIADGHVRAGLAAGDGGVIAWPLAVGVMAAKRYLLTGDWISASDAIRLGLVSEVVPSGQALPRGQEVASRLAKGPQDAIRFTKRAVNHWLRLGITAFNESLLAEGITMTGPNIEAILADIRTGMPGAMPPDRDPERQA